MRSIEATTEPTPESKRRAAAKPKHLDLLAGVPEPTPAAIRQAREAAGHSQEQAAHLVGMAGRLSWWRLESGAPIDPARWALYLLSTGQHPAAAARARRRPPVVEFLGAADAPDPL